MSKSTLSSLFSQWFTEYGRLAYWVARRWVRRLLDRYARDYSPDELEELAQDAIARGFDRFAKRCAKSVCGESDRKKWVCQCVVRGARDAVRAKSRFGSISDGVAVRDDAMNRYKRVAPGFVHGHAIGLTQEQSGILQDVTDRTIRNRLQEIRDYLDPLGNIYAIVCAALEACLTKPRQRDGQRLLPILADAIG